MITNLHFYWHDNNLPVKYKDNLEHNKNIFKGWKIILWNEKTALELLERDFASLKEFYTRLLPNEQQDLLRYIILKQHGGLYSDLDCRWKKEFNIFDYENVFPCEHPKEHKSYNFFNDILINTFFIYSTSTSIFLKKILFYIDKSLLKRDLNPLLYRTAMVFLTYLYCTRTKKENKDHIKLLNVLEYSEYVDHSSDKIYLDNFKEIYKKEGIIN